MGDRGNIFFVDDARGDEWTGIYMYTHWSGVELPSIVKAALERGRDRWGDSQYLGRILFCELVKDAPMDTTGFGLSTQIGDNEHLIVRVNDAEQRVSFHQPGSERLAKSRGVAIWSYDEYVEQPDERLSDAFASGTPAD